MAVRKKIRNLEDALRFVDDRGQRLLGEIGDASDLACLRNEAKGLIDQTKDLITRLVGGEAFTASEIRPVEILSERLREDSKRDILEREEGKIRVENIRYYSKVLQKFLGMIRKKMAETELARIAAQKISDDDVERGIDDMRLEEVDSEGGNNVLNKVDDQAMTRVYVALNAPLGSAAETEAEEPTFDLASEIGDAVNTYPKNVSHSSREENEPEEGVRVSYESDRLSRNTSNKLAALGLQLVINIDRNRDNGSEALVTDFLDSVTLIIELFRSGMTVDSTSVVHALSEKKEAESKILNRGASERNRNTILSLLSTVDGIIREHQAGSEHVA